MIIYSTLNLCAEDIRNGFEIGGIHVAHVTHTCLKKGLLG